MKSKQKLVFSGQNQQSWNILLKKVQKNNLFEEKQKEAKHLIESDSKVHIKVKKPAMCILLHYAGYADSRKSVPNNNRDSINNSQQMEGAIA